MIQATIIAEICRNFEAAGGEVSIGRVDGEAAAKLLGFSASDMTIRFLNMPGGHETVAIFSMKDRLYLDTARFSGLTTDDLREPEEEEDFALGDYRLYFLDGVDDNDDGEIAFSMSIADPDMFDKTVQKAIELCG